MQPTIRPAMLARLERQAAASGRSVEDELDERLRIGFGAKVVLTSIAFGTAVGLGWRIDDKQAKALREMAENWRADMIRHGSPRCDDGEVG